MSATATLPLPLELTQPVELSSTLEDALREAYQIANTKYNHETQVREASDGRPQLHHGCDGGNETSSQCNNAGVLNIDDVLQDFTIVL